MKSKRADQNARAKRAALNALRRARRAVARSAVPLSEWEGEFLGSVEARVENYGRAFRDPEKGHPGQALSIKQGFKVKQIAAKARDKPRHDGLCKRCPRDDEGKPEAETSPGTEEKD